MVSAAFLDEAIALGRRLSNAAIRHAGRCTWLGDDLAFTDGSWQESAGTVGPSLDTGAAGVGWSLARLAAIEGDGAMATLAVEALRQGLACVDTLITKEELGFHRGATGVAWAAIDGGQLLECEELVTNGVRAGLRAAGATSGDGEQSSQIASLDLIRGRAGILAGLLALSDRVDERELLAAASRQAQQLLDSCPFSESAQTLAGGSAGVALALAAWSVRVGTPEGLAAAIELLCAGCDPLDVQYGAPGASVHPWVEGLPMPRSWCSGAAGVGVAHLRTFALAPASELLACAGAAVEFVRRAPPDAIDASVCHGAAGEIDLLVNAATALSQPAHLDAARSAGAQLMASARARGGYGSGIGPGRRSPSLALGLAGTAILLLRLHDPRLAPSPGLTWFNAEARIA